MKTRYGGNGMKPGAKSKGKRIMKTILIVIGSLLGVIIAVGGIYVHRNLNYYKAPIRQTMKAGFTEKQATLTDGTVLNYGEGPDNGPPLLLIHGQAVSWEDYTTVLPKLSEHYHVYAVDCHGHGKSSKDPEKYSAEAMGKDFAWFIENVIGEPAIVSGHSSGGLLTAWLAANAPEQVLGVVLEDPPFFSIEANRRETEFAWVDTFKTCHIFLEQSEEDDFTLYYLKNCYWINFFGNGKQGIVKSAASYREKHPDSMLKIFFLPPSITHIFLFMEDYDPRFGDAFYDSSWMENFDHAETLPRIQCPSVLVHTNWQFKDGILMGAMSGEDAERAHSLIDGNELIKVDSGHDFHYEKPKEFLQIMVDFLEMIR